MFFRTKYNKQYYTTPLYREDRNSQRSNRRLELIKKYKKNGSLLEIGTGVGRLLNILHRHYDIEGLELSRYASKQARRALPGVKIYNKDVHLFKTRRKYDGIIAFNILEHLRKPDHVIRKIYTLLHPGGVFIGSVPSNFGVVGTVHTWITNIIDRTHISTYPNTKWNALFQKNGFHPTYIGEIQLGKNYTTYVESPFWPWVSFNMIFVCKKT